MFYTFQKNNTDICMMTDVLDRLLSDLNQINYEWVKANADPLAMSLGIEAKLIVARQVSHWSLYYTYLNDLYKS